MKQKENKKEATIIKFSPSQANNGMKTATRLVPLVINPINYFTIA